MDGQNLQHNLYQVPVNILYQKLLRSSVVELLQICEKASEENPFLEFERIYTGSDLTQNIFEDICSRDSFIDRLKVEIAYLNLEPKVSSVAEMIIELIDDDGYLRFSIEEISRMVQEDGEIVKKALNAIQLMEPAGIGARNFQECLLLQMKAKKMEKTLAYKVLCECGQDLIAGRFSFIKKKMKLTDAQILDVITEIKKLNPFPARYAFLNLEQMKTKFPDFIIKSIEPTISIEFGEDKIFRIFINNEYAKIINKVTGSEKAFLSQKLSQARRLLQCIENRKRFLDAFLKYIVDYQKDFICNGRPLKPLKETTLAKKFSCSISLVSRAISGKYIAYAGHIFPVKKLFSHNLGNLSQESIIDEIENIIRTSGSVLSDRQISEKLRDKGIEIAPRTVNKYRRKKEILNSYLRRSLNRLENL
ncbi:MAG: hypothetical protein NC913_05950 [Candidatus Omnitrophica bacterium]|nr:hypothetical protein [Candidatus Omnitrophota bacterium]